MPVYKKLHAARAALKRKAKAVLFAGDCLSLLGELKENSVDLVITSPPYAMGRAYEKSHKKEDFIATHRRILPEIARVVKPGGNICWQVGFHVRKKEGVVLPLEYIVYECFKEIPQVKLRNRIVWTFGHGLHCENRFSGRHEVILWFSKDGRKAGHYFDLDSVRVRQKYPGKRHWKGPRKGEHSGNPLGKNPGDVWEIPNVKANHIEKTGHPCQFPVALVQRLVRSLCRRQGLILDPFSGVGTTGVAALIEGRRFVGAEKSKTYIKTADKRLKDVSAGRIKYRPLEQEIYVPQPHEKVAQLPEEFMKANGAWKGVKASAKRVEPSKAKRSQ
jgi:adenine-specific DNA-methyltransferase